ncbi:16S ribosomal RNA methyltransferase A [Halorubrum ezzemoulense]|uniref:Probable ribosomal RNA small subunit methyltransferase A n=1 Tax=Halorubrum ezzemoulense TaxID=337243 RepID=A0A256JFU0_HALEZ|nr:MULTISPECIES: 16S ribosomal RNA methyltransferase A [Halorubrum]MDB2224207.1 16S ribosomal RNA methyltransferase A [Halorubrum ezzemoulense]MDB2238140.1 16S ribosomal RNA methyltransferase A [Halorubrum ezzemoulense]MDB2247609.1 16S ribosomal RNA methyltransferase A [Halorubrum ezzemoulense]MDB2263949.1 16S ribosomal RNA methyltransferase A [Halorubrum ezzemoulense]MDB2269588.1 16S ribosomal RNA methyltransferase A [Halorubrum ezzemoulense]
MTDSPTGEAAGYGSRDPDALARRAGARADPDRDQHFLVDDRVLDRIPGYLPADADGSHLLEIGGGAGALTDRLLAAATADGTADSGRVTVIERDGAFADFLREEFAAAVADGLLDVVEGDALDVDLPPFSACVANLPYGVSSEIAFRLLPEKKPLVLMFQAEFADRMVASAGESEYGRLSVSAQHYADVEIVERVPKEAFDPQPAVESAVVRCAPRDPDYVVGDEAFFLRFVKALFTQRRKTVRNAVRNTAHISGLDEPEAVVDAADEELLRSRPGKLDPAAFAALAELARERGSPTGA